MNKLYLIVLGLLLAFTASAQPSPETIAKREKRKNLVVKEWNKDAKGKNGWLDHVTTYDDQGRKIEEIEYANYGLKERVTFFYEDPSHGKVTKEVVYDGRNKPYKIRKYEYNEDGTKRAQYNYLPNGKLFSYKNYEYIFEDQR